MPQGWGSYDLDADWRVLNSSPEFVEMLGFNIDGLILWEALPHSHGSQFWTAVHRARDLSIPVRNRSTYPVHGMTWESVSTPRPDGTIHVQLRRIDLVEQIAANSERLDRMEQALGEVLSLLGRLPAGGGGSELPTDPPQTVPSERPARQGRAQGLRVAALSLLGFGV